MFGHSSHCLCLNWSWKPARIHWQVALGNTSPAMTDRRLVGSWWERGIHQSGRGHFNLRLCPCPPRYMAIIGLVDAPAGSRDDPASAIPSFWRAFPTWHAKIITGNWIRASLKQPALSQSKTRQIWPKGRWVAAIGRVGGNSCRWDNNRKVCGEKRCNLRWLPLKILPDRSPSRLVDYTRWSCSAWGFCSGPVCSSCSLPGGAWHIVCGITKGSSGQEALTPCEWQARRQSCQRIRVDCIIGPPTAPSSAEEGKSLENKVAEWPTEWIANRTNFWIMTMSSRWTRVAWFGKASLHPSSF